VDRAPATVHRSAVDPPYPEAVWPNLGRPRENQWRRGVQGVAGRRAALPAVAHHGCDSELAGGQPVRRFRARFVTRMLPGACGDDGKPIQGLGSDGGAHHGEGVDNGPAERELR
jgi:hypothetical protein